MNRIVQYESKINLDNQRACCAAGATFSECSLGKSLVPIYRNRIMFAKNLSNKIFLPPRRQDTKFNYNKHLFLCLGAFVAILSGLSGLSSFHFIDYLLKHISGFFPDKHVADVVTRRFGKIDDGQKSTIVFSINRHLGCRLDQQS